MCEVSDNYSQFEARERRQEQWLAKRPLGAECDEPIQDETCYVINGELLCPECLEAHKKWTEDYAE